MDCGEFAYLWRREVTRRCKPHCMSCGSTFLAEESKRAKSEIAKGHDAHERVMAHRARQMNIKNG